MNAEIIIAGIGLIGTLAAYIFGARKSRVDVETQQIDNLTKIADIWKKMSEELETSFTTRIAKLRDENAELRTLVEKLSEENTELRRKMKTLDCENRKLLEELKRFNERNTHEKA